MDERTWHVLLMSGNEGTTLGFDDRVWYVKSYHYDEAMKLFKMTIVDESGNEQQITPEVDEDGVLYLEVRW